MKYVLINDGRYYSDNSNILWQENKLLATEFDLETANRILDNWVKFNTVLTGVVCARSKISQM
jgi:hypothetical protein